MHHTLSVAVVVMRDYVIRMERMDSPILPILLCEGSISSVCCLDGLSFDTVLAYLSGVVVRTRCDFLR